MATDPSATFKIYSKAVEKKPLPDDPATRADIEHVLEHGYVILPDCFSKAEAKEARDEILRLLNKDGQALGYVYHPVKTSAVCLWKGCRLIKSSLSGRNSFEGLNTNRIYSLINKSRVFDKFLIIPRVLALNDFFLDEGYLLSAFHTISINPGEKSQMLHHDDGYIQFPRPRLPFGSAIMVAFDEYTAENGEFKHRGCENETESSTGGTRIIPGSHVWGSDRRGTPEETIPALCPEGGVVYFISTLWHGGGANVSNKPRQSATVQYCQPYIRPIESQILAVDPRKLDHV